MGWRPAWVVPDFASMRSVRPALRWFLYVMIAASTIAHQQLYTRFGWWPIGAISAVVPALLIAIAVTLCIRDRKAPRGGDTGRR